MFARGKSLLLIAPLMALSACSAEPDVRPVPPPGTPPKPTAAPVPQWMQGAPLGEGQVYALTAGQGRAMSEVDARAKGLTVVDLSDNWVPFILHERDAETDEVKPQAYRQTFLDLANDRVDPDALYLRGGGPTKATLPKRLGMAPQQRKAFEEGRKKSRQKGLKRLASAPAMNFLEPLGIPPTISVLQRRLAADAQRSDCYTAVDQAALSAFAGNVTYQSMGDAKRAYQLAVQDARWVSQRLEKMQEEAAGKVAEAAAAGQTDLDLLAAQPKHTARVKRYQRGAARLAAVKATQQRLICEGLLGEKQRFVNGMFDLLTHEALAAFEQKNDIYSWGSLGEETLVALRRTPAELHFETFKRVITERVVEAASILEDESVLGLGKAAHYKDESGKDRTVTDLVGAYRDAFLVALGITGPQDVARLFGSLSPEVLGKLKFAFKGPEKPPYYTAEMQLEVEINRGDVWYDFPFNNQGEQKPQPRKRYPHLTMFVRWNNQRIGLAHWRTTIGSWRSERHPDGNIYYKYKNSDVGPRVWKTIVVSPVWIPPDGTPPKDMLTRKKFDSYGKPETVVNTEVVGPGFASAYGLVMAIHQQPSGYDNQIRTHGSVDYTSIARRYSHGCHRLVNNRAVRMFGFVLAHSAFERLGDQKLAFRKRFAFENTAYEYSINSRGYHFRLKNPIKVDVLEGRIMGRLKKPLTAYVRKPFTGGGTGGGDDDPDGNLALPEGSGGPSPPLRDQDDEPEGTATEPAKPPPPRVIEAGQARALSGKK